MSFPFFLSEILQNFTLIVQKHPVLSAICGAVAVATVLKAIKPKQQPKPFLQHSDLVPLPGTDGQIRYVLGTLEGMDLVRNMICYNHSENNIWVHSPIALDTLRKQELDKWGKIAQIVVPNLYHFLDIGKYCGQYPNATLFYPNDDCLNKAKKLYPKVLKHYSRISADPKRPICPGVVSLGFDGVNKTKDDSYFEFYYELSVTRGKANGGKVLVFNDSLFHNCVEAMQSPLLGRDSSHSISVIGKFIMWCFDSPGPLHVSRISRWFGISNKQVFSEGLLAIANKYDKPINSGGIYAICVSHGTFIIGREACVNALKYAASQLLK